MTNDVAQLPDDPALLKRMIAQGNVEIAERDSAIAQRDAVIEQIKRGAAEQMEALRLRLEAEKKSAIDAILRRFYGPRSEAFDPTQLLLFGLAVAPQTPVDPASDAAIAAAAEAGEKLVTRRINHHKHGRRKLPDHLPRRQVVHDLTDEQKQCPCCGEARACIGSETSEQLEYIPAKFEVLQHVRHKYACKSCGEGKCAACDGQAHIDIATKAAQPIEKGLPGPGLLAYIITSKLGDHRVQGEAVFQMRGGLSWPGDRAGPQTSPNCVSQELSWETSGVNGATRSRQVRSAKSNASEPLMMCRNSISLTPKPGSGGCSGISMGGACNLAHVASGIKAARARIRLGHGTLEPVASMPRKKPKRTTRKGESTDARHRDGTTRSSVEGRVMRLERRGRVIQSSDNRSTVSTGGTYG